MAATLSTDAQNSNSPNARADSRLITSTTASAMITDSASGRFHQCRTYSATARAPRRR